MIPNFLTFDIEEWYHANYGGSDFSRYESQATRLEANVDTLLELCSRHGVRSTCFVLGKVAEKKPGVVKKLADAGHEIASHGYGHALVYDMTPQAFREDLRRSCDLLEQLSGQKISGFRAPSWSLRAEHLPWYYEVLAEQGMTYSSSVYPAHTFLYGIPGFPTLPHRPVLKGKMMPIVEIPVPVVNILGKKIGFAGGFYLRLFPEHFIASAMRSANARGASLFMYLHPREIDPDSPRLELPLVQRLIHYWGLSACARKLDRLVGRFRESFITMREFAVDLHQYSDSQA